MELSLLLLVIRSTVLALFLRENGDDDDDDDFSTGVAVDYARPPLKALSVVGDRHRMILPVQRTL